MIEGLDCLPSNAQGWIKELPEMFTEAVCNNLYALRYIPDWFKTGEMCNEAVEACPLQLKYVPDHFKKQGMRNKAVSRDVCKLYYIHDHFKTQEMCDKAVRREPYISLLPKKCVTRQCATNQQYFF